jgi:hypothetical protein
MVESRQRDVAKRLTGAVSAIEAALPR